MSGGTAVRGAFAAGLVALASASLAHAQEGVCHGPPSNTRLMVTVDGVKNDKGQVAVVLYGDDQKKFLKQELMDTYDPAHAGSTTVCISLPHPGQYALVAYHDANSNKDLDTGLLGVPKEGYGFSNNVRPVLSAPSFNATHIVAAAGDNRLSVRLHYPGH